VTEPTKKHRTLPVLASLQRYQRAWLGADLLAAITLLVIAVPEQLATSRLAGMPPITGFYAFVAGSVVFALLGSNPQMSVGADSTIAPLFAAGVAHLAPLDSPHFIALVGILAVVTGLIVLAVGALRLGWISDFLSAPIISGFMCGVGVIIVVHQLPDFFGLPSASGTTLHRIAFVVSHLHAANTWTVVIGIVVFIVVAGAERIDRRLPGALVGLVASTIVVSAARLQAHGVAVLGTVAHGAPHVGLTGLSWSSLGSVLPIAVVVALVIVSQSAATTRAFADQGGYDVDVGRDFIGVGAGSVVAGLLGAFPVNASPARTTAVASAGGKTQVSSLGAAAIVILVVPVAGLLKDVPLATLAAVLIFVAARVFRLHDLVNVFRFSAWEFALAIVTLLTVALVGVEQGIAVAVGLAIAMRIRLSARPSSYEMGRIAGTTSWEPLGLNKGTAPVPGVIVFLFSSSLYFANAEFFRASVNKALQGADTAPTLFVLDAAAMDDIDYTGGRALVEVVDYLEKSHITLAVARAVGATEVDLERSGCLEKIGRDHFFPSVDAAVRAFGPPGASTEKPGT
jgi:sulfate permease, SulP family